LTLTTGTHARRDLQESQKLLLLALHQRDLHWALPVLERAMGIYCDAHLSNFFAIPAAVARKTTTIELPELVAH
jgi:hypothetical protein